MERKWDSLWEPIQWTYDVETGRTACHCTADVRTRYRTYDHCVARKSYFCQMFHNSCFPWFRTVIVGIGLIEGFYRFGEPEPFGVFRDTYWPRWVLTHIMRIVIFHALDVYFVYQENMHILQLSPFVLIVELCHFGKNVVLNLLTKWDL
jgi:hypothetical protein